MTAKTSTYLCAQQMGHLGQPLVKTIGINGQLKSFSYLGGDVIHYKVVGGDHDAIGFISEHMLLNFLGN